VAGGETAERGGAEQRCGKGATEAALDGHCFLRFASVGVAGEPPEAPAGSRTMDAAFERSRGARVKLFIERDRNALTGAAAQRITVFPARSAQAGRPAMESRFPPNDAAVSWHRYPEPELAEQYLGKYTSDPGRCRLVFILQRQCRADPSAQIRFFKNFPHSASATSP
jgi:hypothetical protein